MPKWLKIVLLVGVGLFLMCGLGIGGVSYWINQNKDSLKAKGESMVADARAFAAKSDSAGCLQETLARLKKEPGFMYEVSHRIFLAECLKSAARSDKFCDGVPAFGEIMQGALFANQSCVSYDGPKEACGRMMQEVTKFCSAKTK